MEFRNHLEKWLPFVGPTFAVGVVAVLATGSVSHFESVKNTAAVNAAEVFALTNGERSGEGVTSLQRNALLDQAAQMKAQDMAAKGYYAHVSPEGLTPMHWVEKAGYKYLIIGENLVVNRTDADQVVDAFMGSPGHRANILRRDFTEIGIGVANGTYKGKNATFTVQIFAAPYPVAAPAPKPAPKPAVKPVQATPAKAPVKAAAAVAAVPRAAVASSTRTVPQPKPEASVGTSKLSSDVKRLISPIVSSFEVTSTATTTVGPITLPLELSIPFSSSAPVELSSVSQLEDEALPIQIGSSWSMELKVLLEKMMSRARSVFAS